MDLSTPPTLSLGYSPCPNDTFIFYALVHGRIPTGARRYKEVLADVQELNRRALTCTLDVTKVSFAAFAELREGYGLLRSGAALGRGCGPLIVAPSGYAGGTDSLRGRRIAIPGEMTTAYLLMRLYDMRLAEDVVSMPFDRIMPAVRDGIVEAGLIIHEGRFTYQSYGLREVRDLGAWWEEETGMPIPLGCILARRALGPALSQDIERDLRASLEYSFAHRAEPEGYIKQHSQELAEDVIRQHIGLYVNEYTVDLGAEGVAAVERLFGMAEERGLLERSAIPLFID